jgi:site-specific recombinase XerD
VDGLTTSPSLRPPARATARRPAQGGFHRLRHSSGTHTALFGVNPWRLQAWMGHKRIDETMLYVHVAETHRRDIRRES